MNLFRDFMQKFILSVEEKKDQEDIKYNRKQFRATHQRTWQNPRRQGHKYAFPGMHCWNGV